MCEQSFWKTQGVRPRRNDCTCCCYKQLADCAKQELLPGASLAITSRRLRSAEDRHFHAKSTA
jgi:hypothetical protein